MKSEDAFPFSQFPTEPRFMELLPGEVGLGMAGDQFKTLLGSCVAVILTDPRRTVGAMCHIVHVGQPQAQDAANTAYGGVAMAELFRLLRGVGVVPTLCQAFVYGGGNMFPNLYTGDTVGARNVRWVMDFLAGQGIAVVQQSLQGNGHRVVSWTVGTALPTVKLVPLETE